MNYRLKIIEELGGKCMYVDQETGLGCSMRWNGQPIDNVDMLHVEHVNGGGNEERRMINKEYASTVTNSYSYGQLMRAPINQQYYKHILDNLHTGQYQLLCANHHALKTAEERRQRKQAQTLAKGQETSMPDTQYYEQKETNRILHDNSLDGSDSFNRIMDAIQNITYTPITYQLGSALPNYFTLACDNEK